MQLSGTNMMAHKIRPYTNTTFDNHHTSIAYTDEQAYPSPHLMPRYDLLERKSDADFIVNHRDLSSALESSVPDFGGGCIEQYMTDLHRVKWLKQIDCVFSSDESPSVDMFKECSDNLDKEKLVDFAVVYESVIVKKLFAAAGVFQREAVRKWNPNADDVTLCNYMGLIGIDEAVSKECGTITLDLLLKFGIVHEVDDGSYALADDFKSKRCYMFGVVKTVDNIDKMANDLVNRPMSLSESSK